MKKIIFTFALLVSTVVISNAQTTNAAQSKDSTAATTDQVEFYSSEEEFLKKNPSFSEDVKKSIAINNEAYLNFLKTYKISRKRLLA